MSDGNHRVAASGFPLATIMFLIFMTLKLTGHIDWSWFWVAAPLWGSVALFLVGVFVVFVGVLIASGVSAIRHRRKRQF